MKVVAVAALAVALFAGAVALGDDDADAEAVAAVKEADQAAKKGDFEAAAAGYKKFLAHLPKLKVPERARKSSEAFLSFHLARVLARKGDKEGALAALERAAESGFRPAKQLATERTLAELRDEERFKKVLAKVEAGEKEDGAQEPRLPGNAFEGAKAGDWSAYRGTIVANGKPTVKTVLSVTVSKVADGKVTVDIAQAMLGGARAPARTQVFEAKEPPTVRQFLEFNHGERIVAAKTEDAKKKAGDRTFDCKKLTFDLFLTGATGGVELYLSPEVKGSGRVHVIMTLDNALRVPGQVEKVEYELAGFGPKGEKTWGVTAEDLAKE